VAGESEALLAGHRVVFVTDHLGSVSSEFPHLI
jgi:hypothetical protein